MDTALLKSLNTAVKTNGAPLPLNTLLGGVHMEVFFYTGSRQIFTVPDGVSEIWITACGGGGGGGDPSNKVGGTGEATVIGVLVTLNGGGGGGIGAKPGISGGSGGGAGGSIGMNGAGGICGAGGGMTATFMNGRCGAGGGGSLGGGGGAGAYNDNPTRTSVMFGGKGGQSWICPGGDGCSVDMPHKDQYHIGNSTMASPADYAVPNGRYAIGGCGDGGFGGGGGASSVYRTTDKGGGGAAAVFKKKYAVTPGSQISVYVGKGGEGGEGRGDYYSRHGNGGNGLVIIEW